MTDQLCPDPRCRQPVRIPQDGRTHPCPHCGAELMVASDGVVDMVAGGDEARGE